MPRLLAPSSPTGHRVGSGTRTRHDRQTEHAPRAGQAGWSWTGKRRFQPKRGRSIVVHAARSQSYQRPAGWGRHRQPPPGLHATNHSPAPHVPRRIRCPPCCRCGWLRCLRACVPLPVAARGGGPARARRYNRNPEGPDRRTDTCRIPRPPSNPFPPMED